jgi:hypothetical protein
MELARSSSHNSKLRFVVGSPLTGQVVTRNERPDVKHDRPHRRQVDGAASMEEYGVQERSDRGGATPRAAAFERDGQCCSIETDKPAAAHGDNLTLSIYWSRSN